MKLIDISLKLNNFPIKKAEQAISKIHELSEIEFQKYVDTQKEEIVNFHYKNNRFYNSIVKQASLDWNSLPVLEKKDLQMPLEKRLSKNYALHTVFKNKTSGSTGNPFYFAKDKYTHALTWGIIKNRFNWHNLYGKKQARFYGLPKDNLSRKKELIKDLLSNRKRFDVFNLSDEALQTWVNQFKKHKFVYLNGYTSVLVVFAKYLIKRNIVLKDICKSVSACVVTSEMLVTSDKIILEKGFGVKIINEYGASELDLIAFEDVNGNWVLNNETLYIEILDENNKPVPYGEIGNIVITSLYNKAHPFIRYKLGDRGAIKKINHKKYILENLEGRSEDLVKLPSGKVSPGLTFYYVTKSVMEDSGNVKEIKVIQTSFDKFRIEYVADEKLHIEEQTKIKHSLLKYLEPNLTIDFKKLKNLERNKSGKLKQFTSLLKD
ncbi:phenylacetate--CoA ligase family protein [Polaribacter sp. WD7]|uniref:phenylacetate--CoA ligase family protein n=1 Tax=Polaribacter sp. WD7 TaxID=2269061 RepID=UPI000DF49122|nr:phenylacetate--CoA ligase family protein [Polaribacter sp. WD7]RCS27051.1 phenylacetate--CoA ligase family protein [Polaribacter sp. WD7]